jgi:hypothetical protein
MNVLGDGAGAVTEGPGQKFAGYLKVKQLFFVIFFINDALRPSNRRHSNSVDLKLSVKGKLTSSN